MDVSQPAQALLSAQALSTERGGRTLFANLSFAVTPGQIVQIEGANGVGKTTLLRILCGLSRYGYEGSVERAESLLYLGHRSAIKTALSPRENLHWHSGGEALDGSVDEALAIVGLRGYEDTLCASLSAGQQRRVGLARLFLSGARLWLLDEPFTAIDQAGVTLLQRRFVEHARQGGAVVLTSHQPLHVDWPVERLVINGSGQI